MEFYKEHKINPVGRLPAAADPDAGVLDPLLRRAGPHPEAQVRRASRGCCRPTTCPRRVVTARASDPKYLDHVHRAVPVAARPDRDELLRHRPVDSAGAGAEQGFVTALPYILLVGGHRLPELVPAEADHGPQPQRQVNPQQQMIMRIVPADVRVLRVRSARPAIVIYFLVSTLWRVGQQAFITRRSTAARTRSASRRRRQCKRSARPRRTALGNRPASRPDKPASARPRSTGASGNGKTSTVEGDAGRQADRSQRDVLRGQAAPPVPQEEEEEVAQWNGS